MLKEHLTPLEEQGILETLRRVIPTALMKSSVCHLRRAHRINPADNLVARFKKPKAEHARPSPQ